MNKNGFRYGNLKGLVTLSLLFLARITATNTYQPCTGMVIDADDNTPVESVRVASSMFIATTYTTGSGEFTLPTGEQYPCRPDSVYFTVEEGVTVSLSHQSGQQTRYTDHDKPLVVLLCDLKGRIVKRSQEKKNNWTIYDERLTPGVYLLSVSGFTPQAILVNRNRIEGSIKKIPHTTSKLLPATCTKDDTVYFCKFGYVPVAYPRNDLDTSVQIRMHKKQWVASDLHNHTVLTDGQEIQDTLCRIAFDIGGLDVYVNSEHGGSYNRDTTGVYFRDTMGAILYQPRWYTLAKYSWPKILNQRNIYPGKIILQGLEWNCPGHEHASVCMISDADQPEAISRFAYMFDFNNSDRSLPELPNYNQNLHENALKGVAWLKQYYPLTSYCFINHPSREAIGPYNVNDFRDFNNMAPDICFGFEGMPGHHRDSYRGGYGYIYNDRNRTWGGTDHVCAKIGGIWDALLGEGRHFFTIVNSDFHYREESFFPGVYAKTWTAVTDTGAQAWLDGMRSGEMFIVHGDLISTLDFSVDDGIRTVWMGSELHTAADSVTVTIRFSSPPRNNNNDIPQVDHIDLISGAITGIIPPSHSNYFKPVNPTTTIHHRFSSTDWKPDDHGIISLRYTLPITRSMYFRLRGTNLPINTEGEVDAFGNPMVDIDGMNTDAIAWNDLWFYSNPVYVVIQ